MAEPWVRHQPGEHDAAYDLQIIQDNIELALAPLTSVKNHTLIENRSPPQSLNTSSTFVTLESSEVTTFSGRPVLFFLNISQFSSGGIGAVEYAIQIDDGLDNVISQLFHNGIDVHEAAPGAVVITPTRGTHIVRLRWRRRIGPGTLVTNSNDQHLVHAVEL